MWRSQNIVCWDRDRRDLISTSVTNGHRCLMMGYDVTLACRLKRKTRVLHWKLSLHKLRSGQTTSVTCIVISALDSRLSSSLLFLTAGAGLQLRLLSWWKRCVQSYEESKILTKLRFGSIGHVRQKSCIGCSESVWLFGEVTTWLQSQDCLSHGMTVSWFEC